MQKKALGRGLDALIAGGVVRTVVAEPPHTPITVRPLGSEVVVVPQSGIPDASGNAAEDSGRSNNGREDGVKQLTIDCIERSRFQPRAKFDPEQMRELADSIKQRGLVQPLLVRPLSNGKGNGRYELIAGERRWRAAREAGLTTIPAIVREASDEEALEIALIENLQREDLNAIEEARAYEQLATKFGLTQEQIAEKVGRNRATVANALRLLALPDEVQSWIAAGRLSVGHAKAILGLAIVEEQRLVADRVLRENLTVRQTEQLVEQVKEGKRRIGRAPANVALKSPQLLAIEAKLQEKLATRVTVYHGRKKGRIEIEYYGNDDLNRLLGIFGIDGF